MRASLGLALLLCLAIPAAAFADSAGPSLNPYRAYPPSCLALPLPSPPPAGPTYGAAITVLTYDEFLQPAGSETVTYVFWRVPCSGGKSAMVGEMNRTADYTNKFPAPILGGFRGSQGNIADHLIRVAAEPNTVLSSIPPDQIVLSDVEFVFENDATASFDYSQPFSISIETNRNPVEFDFPAYDPSQYPAPPPMQISGYMTGNWYDQAHSGEGIQVEVGELQGSGGSQQRYITIAWYTYDASGIPYWLFGSGVFNVGDRSADVNLGYSAGGGFAGNFGASATQKLWGTLNVQFPDCNTMQFTFQSTNGLPLGVPTGTGTKTWKRLTQMNGLECE